MKKTDTEMLNKPYYSKLLIYTRTRWILGFLAIVFTIIFAGFIITNRYSGADWTLLIVPLGLMGLLLVLFPATEEWVYRPWQVHPQQYERHMAGR